MSVPHWAASPAAIDHWPARLDAMLHYWLAGRTCTVAAKTLRTDQDLLRLIPANYLARDPHTITDDDLDVIGDHLRSRGLSELSVRRHLASLSQFFAWMRRLGVASAGPGLASLGTRPAPPANPAAARPLNSEELDQAWGDWAQRDPHLADVMLVLARTGLRWSEARVLQVGDYVSSQPALLVNKAASEGTVTRALAPERVRQVPLVDKVAPILARMATRRDVGDLLLTTKRGCQLHRTAVLRGLDWTRSGRGRRLHDLRHTAAHLWLAEGIPPAKVEAWMGHTLLAAAARHG